MPLTVVVLMTVIIAALTLIGVLIKYYRCYWLISGYNTMSLERKRNVDAEGLGNFMGNCCFALAAILLAGSIANFLGVFVGFAIALGSIFPFVAYMLVASQKYFNRDGKTTVRSKVGTISAAGLIILLFVIVTGSVLYGAMESKISVNKEYIDIPGVYSTRLGVSEIKEVSLDTSLPAVERKINGYDFGDIRKGSFMASGVGQSKLYINRGKPPYIHIIYQDGHVFLNSKDARSTENLYNEIRQYLKK
ncbi:MAG: DUF3784 domain-containing protein [Clostridia bacterium]|nr:DUF3784 domain-containing protein [Clostridia bacterium]